MSLDNNSSNNEEIPCPNCKKAGLLEKLHNIYLLKCYSLYNVCMIGKYLIMLAVFSISISTVTATAQTNNTNTTSMTDTNMTSPDNQTADNDTGKISSSRQSSGTDFGAGLKGGIDKSKD